MLTDPYVLVCQRLMSSGVPKKTILEAYQRHYKLTYLLNSFFQWIKYWFYLARKKTFIENELTQLERFAKIAQILPEENAGVAIFNKNEFPADTQAYLALDEYVNEVPKVDYSNYQSDEERKLKAIRTRKREFLTEGKEKKYQPKPILSLGTVLFIAIDRTIRNQVHRKDGYPDEFSSPHWGLFGESANPSFVWAKILLTLQTIPGILTEEVNPDFFLEKEDNNLSRLGNFTQALEMLHSANLLTLENKILLFEELKQTSTPRIAYEGRYDKKYYYTFSFYALAKALINLNDVGLLNEATRTKLNGDCDHADNLNRIFRCLKEENILTKEIIKKVVDLFVEGKLFNEFARLFMDLQINQSLTPITANLLLHYPPSLDGNYRDSEILFEAIRILKDGKLLREDVYKKLSQHKDNILGVSYAIYFFYQSSLPITFERVNHFFDNCRFYSGILLTPRFREIFYRIPSYQKEAIVPHVFTICSRNQGNVTTALQAIETYVNTALGREARREPVKKEPQINYSQSTHNAAVEKSINESALRLKERYGSVLTGEVRKDMLDEISKWGHKTLNGDALIAFNDILNNKFKYERQVSEFNNVSMQDMLILAWVALKDDARRIIRDEKENETKISLESALGLFASAFDEIQRGYNKSDTDEDRGGKAKEICIGGTFNKLVEKLYPNHIDVQLKFVTPLQKALKIRALMNEKMIAHLNAVRNESEEKYNILITEITNSGFPKENWDLFKSDVRTKIEEEFGELDSKDNEVIETGHTYIPFETPEMRLNQIINLLLKEYLINKKKEFSSEKYTQLVSEILTTGIPGSVLDEITPDVKKTVYKHFSYLRPTDEKEITTDEKEINSLIEKSKENYKFNLKEVVLSDVLKKLKINIPLSKEQWEQQKDQIKEEIFEKIPFLKYLDKKDLENFILKIVTGKKEVRASQVPQTLLSSSSPASTSADAAHMTEQQLRDRRVHHFSKR